MENVHNEKTEDTKSFGDDEFEWKIILRQVRFLLFLVIIFVKVLIASSTWVIYFSAGIFMGAPTVIIPQMRREANSTAAVSEEMASWLSSTFSYSAIPWAFLLPNLARVIGRKKTFIIVSLSTITTFLIFSFNTTPMHLLISEILIGLTYASSLTTNVIVISEYTSPKFRGLFLTIKTAGLFWGIWISNTIGTFTHWRYIPIFGLICTFYSLTVFFWPESPHWLASKKRFAECRKVHIWLKGTGAKSEAELDQLIKYFSNHKEEKLYAKFKLITKKEFYMPLFISVLTVAQYHLSGKFVFMVYAIEIMKKIMDSEKNAYRSMLILDAITVFSTYVGCVVIKAFKRRTVLLTASGIATAFLFSMSFYLYLIKLSLIAENMYLSLFFLAGFSISISCGPIIMSTSLYGELIPVRFKSVCLIIIAITFIIFHGTLLKISPLIFKTLGTAGTFLFYGCSSFVCVVLVYAYLPETKDKTLLQIEEYFKDSVSVEESKQLVKPTFD